MKVPVGYYILGIAVRDDSPYHQTPVTVEALSPEGLIG